MADQTGIEWADATFNPWIGCTKVSPACDNCYAAVSTPARTLGIQWGANQPRRRTAPANWTMPRRWNAQPFWECAGCGWRGEEKRKLSSYCPSCCYGALMPARRRVFCASLADVFDNEVPAAWRVDVLFLIWHTPNLDWLLLTKRIGNVPGMLRDAIRLVQAAGGSVVFQRWLEDWNEGAPPPNVWIGATICNQTEANRDIPKLVQTPAAVRFLSIEPMLGRVDLCEVLGIWWNQTMGCWESSGSCINLYFNGRSDGRPLIGWVIAGGESGPSARAMHPDWVRSLRGQCAAAAVPFLFKQWGEWVDTMPDVIPGDRPVLLEEPGLAAIGGEFWPVKRIGKKAAGRTLDGVLHNGYPAPRA